MYDIYLMLYVQSWTLDDGRIDRPKHVPRRVLFQNKINLRYCASVWFYYRNVLRATVLQTSNFGECWHCNVAGSETVQSGCGYQPYGRTHYPLF
jgi:hypothetical protein